MTQPFFADELSRFGDRVAILHPGGALAYRELAERVEARAAELGPARGLVLLECRNELEPLIAYLAALRARHPVLLVPEGKGEATEELIARYRPAVALRLREGAWRLERLGGADGELHPDLAVLLSTSGSTGTAKLVRLSRDNVQANAASIREYLGIGPDERAATTLPFHYSYGLSVVNSHLLAGGSLWLTAASVVDAGFWDDFRRAEATSFAGVPYTFELLERCRFEELSLPRLRTVTQAGGRLGPERVARFAQLARRAGWSLVVMYGQTEATARMSWVPPELLADHPGCIGVPIPGGSFRLVDEDGREVTGIDQPGELVYRGPNVMMGYATGRDDLARGPELEELATGDLAVCNAAGLYRVVGRKSRFLKLYGLRISLDELDRRLEQAGVRALATGTDERLVIATLDRGQADALVRRVAEWLELPAAAIAAREYDDYPLLPSGKVDYPRIVREAAPPAAAPSSGDESHVRAAFRRALGTDRPIQPDDTFAGLGGDSLSYVQVSLELEERLGRVPPDWHRTPVAALEALEPRRAILHGVEVTILLRALAIFLIVSSHFRWFSIATSVNVLLGVAGFNFAQFQLGEVVARGSVRPVLGLLLRVLIPCIAYTTLVELAVHRRFSVPVVAMVSNFVGPHLWGYWFVEVLLQLLLGLALLLSLRRVREAIRARPYGSALAFAGGAGLLALVGPLVWDAEPLFNRVPHMRLWPFALGWCIQAGLAAGWRWPSALLVGCLVPLLGVDRHGILFLLPALLALVWVRQVPLIWPLHRLVGLVGGASMYVYLTHFQVQSLVKKVVGARVPPLEVAVALMAGVALWRLAEWAMARVGLTRRLRGTGAT